MLVVTASLVLTGCLHAMVMTDSKLEFLLGWLMSPALKIGVTSDVFHDWGTKPVLNAVKAFNKAFN